MSDDRIIAEIAQFMAEDGHRLEFPDALEQVAARWPGATGRQLKAAVLMAAEAKKEESEHYLA